MGALPKNKITRVERGKRRAGNTPSLKKDTNASVPLHKRGLVAQILKKAGVASATTESRAAKRASKADQKAAKAVAADTKAAQKASSAAIKKTTRTTQHKG